jgi:flagellar motor switch protein FliM
LSASLRAPIELGVASIEQFSYGEFLTTVADPTAYYGLSLAPFETPGALDVSPIVAFAVIDRMMGGDGKSAAPARALSDIELNIVDRFVRQLLDGLTAVWKPLAGASFGIKARESRPQMLTLAAADDPMVVLALDAQIGDVKGVITLALPAAVVEAGNKDGVRRKLAPSASPTEREWVRRHLGRIPLAVDPLVETRLAGRDVIALAPGDVVSLGLPVGDPLTVRVGGRAKLQGRLVADNGRVWLQVVGTPDAGAAAAGEA